MALTKGEKIELTDINSKVSKSDILSYQDILASANLTDKTVSAKSFRDSRVYCGYHSDEDPISLNIPAPCLIFLDGQGNGHYYIGSAFSIVDTIISDNHYDSNISYDWESNMLTLPSSGWYVWFVIPGDAAFKS